MEPIKSFSFPLSSFAALVFLFLLSSQTLHAAKISDTVISRKINATPDQVFSYIQDFCNAYLYSPLDVSFCTKGVPNEPGLIRYFTLKGPPPTGGNSTIVLWEEQQLLSISHKHRSIVFTLLDTNRGISYYKPTMQVVKNGSGSQIYWPYIVDLGELYTRETFHAIISIAASGMADKIENLVASSLT